MLLLFHRMIPVFLILYALFAASYYGILRKTGLDPSLAFVPFAAEWKLSHLYFAGMGAFYRPAAAMLIYYAAARYVGKGSTYSVIFFLVGLAVYTFFLMRLYGRIAKSFGKGVPMRILTALAPFIFLPVLGYGKSRFQGAPTFKIREAPKFVRILAGIGAVLFTIAEFALLISVVGFFSIRENPPRVLTEFMAQEDIARATGITDRGPVITRADVMDEAAAEAALAQRSREHYFPDHDSDETVVVMDYVIATDLESTAGMASVNIAQLQDATKLGSNMTVVMQLGGAEHVFTNGMEDGSYARYTIQDGKIEKILTLDPKTCMTEGENLTDFIRWTKKKYPADRYMLVFWDHGGGLMGGYGYDQLNQREDGETHMLCSDLIEAVGDAGVQFDLIGFDTCLMQDIDIACCLEPYADYYVASEETESGYGWNYTVAFSELAKNPSIPTEEFGEYLVSSFDPYNAAMGNGETDTRSTLSLLDLTLVKPAHDKLDALLNSEKQAILADADNYANVSIAANGAYTFVGDTQIDLIDYLTRLKEMDYADAILTDQQMQELIDAIRACVVLRNANSADGINGVSFCFPVKAIKKYAATHDQLDALGLTPQKSMSDDFFSIMACQQKKALGDAIFLMELFEDDYTEEDWYVKGFEEYDTTDTFVDIPLFDTGAGYRIELPEKAWKTIVDCQTVVYLLTGEGRLYIGNDHIGSLDENGNPMVAMDNTWPHIGSNLIWYSANPPRETEEGTVFSGESRAILNGKKEIELYIECDPVAEESEQPVEGYVIGYEVVNDPFSFMSKGMQQLQAGDTLEFLFYYYDEEGNQVDYKPYGKKLTVTSDKRLTVKDEPLGACDIWFGGMLTDIYQRTFLTELLAAHLDK